MAKILITKSLTAEIQRTFNISESNKVLDLLETLAENPKKGKTLRNVRGIIIKEIRYKKYRFYFITDGHILKFGTANELASLLIKFVKMSDKKNQQQTIDKIKSVLRSLGFEGL